MLLRKTSLGFLETLTVELSWQQAGNFHKTKFPRGSKHRWIHSPESGDTQHACYLNAMNKKPTSIQKGTKSRSVLRMTAVELNEILRTSAIEVEAASLDLGYTWWAQKRPQPLQLDFIFETSMQSWLAVNPPASVFRVLDTYTDIPSNLTGSNSHFGRCSKVLQSETSFIQQLSSMYWIIWLSSFWSACSGIRVIFKCFREMIWHKSWTPWKPLNLLMEIIKKMFHK